MNKLNNEIRWRSYCTICLIKPDISEKDILSKIELYKKFLEKNVPKEDIAETNVLTNSLTNIATNEVSVLYKGKRRLTYTIKKYTNSYFCEFYFWGNGNLVELFLKYLRLDDDIIRQQVTRMC